MDPLTSTFLNASGLNDTSLIAHQRLAIIDEPYLSIVVIILSITSAAAFIASFAAICLIWSQYRRNQRIRKRFNQQLAQGGRGFVSTVRRGSINPTSGNELRLYLMNLFVSDLLVSLMAGPPIFIDYIYGKWIFPTILCPVTNFFSLCCVTVSIYTLIAIGIERYIAILHPFNKDYFLRRHSKWIIVLTWIFGISLASPAIVVNRAVSFNQTGEELFDCREIWSSKLNSKIYTILVFVFTFLLPLIGLAFLYGSIVRVYFNHIVPGNVDVLRDQIQQRQKMKVLRMLIILVVVFAICWFPIQLYNLVMWMCDDCTERFASYYNSFVAVTVISMWLSTAHSLFDPIIYCFGSENFKFSDVSDELKGMAITGFVFRSYQRFISALGLATSANSMGSPSIIPSSGQSSSGITEMTELTSRRNRGLLAISTLNENGNTSMKLLSPTTSLVDPSQIDSSDFIMSISEIEL